MLSKYLILLLLLFKLFPLSGAEIVIRSLNKNDWEEFRDLRLMALKEEPLAYGIAVDEETAKSDDDWKMICEDAFEGRGKWFFIAEHEKKLIGMLGAVEIPGHYMRHQVEICQAFVDPAFRRQGIFTKLYTSLKRELEKVPYLEQMITWVTLHENQTSYYAFEKFGFKRAGTLSKTVKFENKYYDCCWLEAPLHTSNYNTK